MIVVQNIVTCAIGSKQWLWNQACSISCRKNIISPHWKGSYNTLFSFL